MDRFHEKKVPKAERDIEDLDELFERWEEKAVELHSAGDGVVQGILAKQRGETKDTSE